VAAHIHRGAAGTNGPVAVPSTAPGANGNSSGCATAAAAMIDETARAPGAYWLLGGHNQKRNLGGPLMHPTHRLKGVALACALAAAFAASALAAGSAPIVKVGSTGLGKILVDSRGHTLYLFEHDKGGKSSCAGQCATFWPPLLTTAKATAGTGAKASMLGTTRRADGKLQVTYHGHPLYFFAKDARAGQTTGEELSAFGGEWYALSPAGVKVGKHSGPSSGGGGYGSGSSSGSGSGYGYGG
jgi:predicted lipoprotein with Yx(FWY)xxD motif